MRHRSTDIVVYYETITIMFIHTQRYYNIRCINYQLEQRLPLQVCLYTEMYVCRLKKKKKTQI